MMKKRIVSLGLAAMMTTLWSRRIWLPSRTKILYLLTGVRPIKLFRNVSNEQGFPGNAVVDVTFKVTGENALAIIYNAKADKTTTFNMTNEKHFDRINKLSQDRELKTKFKK